MSEKVTVPLISGLVAGIAASLCCVAPLVLLFLGFTGAWISNLTVLEPYRPIFIVVALSALLVAYFQIFTATVNKACAEDQVLCKTTKPAFV